MKNLFTIDDSKIKTTSFNQQPSQLDYRTLKPNYGVTDFENNKEVIKDAEKVLGYFGSNDEIVEWLRDAEISTTSLVARAFKAKNAPDDVKLAYARLQNNFRKAIKCFRNASNKTVGSQTSRPQGRLQQELMKSEESAKLRHDVNPSLVISPRGA